MTAPRGESRAQRPSAPWHGRRPALREPGGSGLAHRWQSWGARAAPAERGWLPAPSACHHARGAFLRRAPGRRAGPEQPSVVASLRGPAGGAGRGEPPPSGRLSPPLGLVSFPVFLPLRPAQSVLTGERPSSALTRAVSTLLPRGPVLLGVPCSCCPSHLFRKPWSRPK